MPSSRLTDMPRTSPPETPVMAEVRKAGAKYRRAQAARDKALAELQEAIRRADADGNGRYVIIRAAGVAKQTVYDALKDQPAQGASDG